MTMGSPPTMNGTRQPGVSEGRAVGVDGDRRQNIRRLEIKHRVYDGMFRSGFPGLAPAVPPPAVSRFIRRPFRFRTCQCKTGNVPVLDPFHAFVFSVGFIIQKNLIAGGLLYFIPVQSHSVSGCCSGQYRCFRFCRCCGCRYCSKQHYRYQPK